MLTDTALQFTFLLGCRTQFRSNEPFLENGLEISEAFPCMNSYSLHATLIHIDYQPPVTLSLSSFAKFLNVPSILLDTESVSNNLLLTLFIYAFIQQIFECLPWITSQQASTIQWWIKQVAFNFIGHSFFGKADMEQVKHINTSWQIIIHAKKEKEQEAVGNNNRGCWLHFIVKERLPEEVTFKLRPEEKSQPWEEWVNHSKQKGQHVQRPCIRVGLGRYNKRTKKDLCAWSIVRNAERWRTDGQKTGHLRAIQPKS